MDFLIVPIIAVAIALLGAPKPVDRVVLLPQTDGKPSAVVVRSAAGETVLDRPYAAVDVNRQGVQAPAQTDPDAVRTRFGAVLDAQPPRPVSYLVYFVTGKDELTAESMPVLEQVKAELSRRPAPEIVVIGHTDRVGSETANDQLSRRRAGFVKDALLAAGVDASRVEVAGRGEREPLVPTADGVDEPKNRRVEISIR